MSSQPPDQPPSDRPRPKRVEDLPTLEIHRQKPRTRSQSRQAESSKAVFGITSLGDVLKAAQTLFSATVKKP